MHLVDEVGHVARVMSIAIPPAIWLLIKTDAKHYRRLQEELELFRTLESACLSVKINRMPTCVVLSKLIYTSHNL